MRTTVNLEPDAYLLARALATQRRTTLGEILSEALLKLYRPEPDQPVGLVIDKSGFPTFYLGRTITSEEVAAAIEED